jgi:excisionase family DNA binding protein
MTHSHSSANGARIETHLAHPARIAHIPGQLSLPVTTLSGSNQATAETEPSVEPAICMEMLDKQQLARYFGVSVDTIERLVKAGDLTAVRIGSQIRFTREDVDAFIDR